MGFASSFPFLHLSALQYLHIFCSALYSIYIYLKCPSILCVYLSTSIYSIFLHHLSFFSVYLRLHSVCSVYISAVHCIYCMYICSICLSGVLYTVQCICLQFILIYLSICPAVSRYLCVHLFTVSIFHIIFPSTASLFLQCLSIYSVCLQCIHIYIICTVSTVSVYMMHHTRCICIKCCIAIFLFSFSVYPPTLSIFHVLYLL